MRLPKLSKCEQGGRGGGGEGVTKIEQLGTSREGGSKFGAFCYNVIFGFPHTSLHTVVYFQLVLNDSM